MKRIKTLLILAFAITLVVLISGCGLVGSRSAGVDTGAATMDELPQWLTLAHRVEAAEEEPAAEEDEAEGEEEQEVAEAPSQAATTQPATTQPADTQPASQTGTPRWQQPGTMEYLAKLQMDQTAIEIRRLNSEIANADRNTNVQDLKTRRAALVRGMYAIGEEIGLNVQSVYGIPPVASGATGSGEASWFVNWNESPSGFGN